MHYHPTHTPLQNIFLVSRVHCGSAVRFGRALPGFPGARQAVLAAARHLLYARVHTEVFLKTKIYLQIIFFSENPAQSAQSADTECTGAAGVSVPGFLGFL